MEDRAPVSITQSAFWLVLAKTAAFAFSFIVPLFLVRHMSQTEFGLYKQTFLAVNTAITLFPLGFAMSAFYFLPQESSRRNAVVLNILLFYVFIGLAAFAALAARPEIIATVFNASDLTEYAPLIGAVIAVWVTGSFLEFIAIANGEAKLASAFLLGAHFSRAVVFGVAAFFFTSLAALLYAALIHGVVQTAVTVFYLHHRFPEFWRRFDATMMRAQLVYAVPLGLVGVLYYLQTDLHHYFVSNAFGPEGYAIYAVGCFELPLLGILIESVRAVVIARVGALRHENNTREIVRLCAGMIRTLAAAFFPAYALFLVTGREFIAFLFTPRYLDSWPIFAVNITLIPLMVFGSPTDPVFRAYPEHRFFLLATRCFTFLVLLFALWFGISRFQMLGAVSAIVAVNLLEEIIFGAKVVQILKPSWRDLTALRDVGKLALATAAAGAVAALAREIVADRHPFAVLAICGAAFTAIYVALIFLLKVPTPDELHALRKGAERLRLPALWKKLADSAAGG